jgi:DNA-binding CsgD family transcriptional regulator
MPQTDEISLTERQQYWLKHIRACDAAGQTSIEYARAHGINVKTLYSARKALAEKGTLPRPQAVRFQKVQAPGGHPRSDNQWRIQMPNGVVVAFSGELDASTLSLVLSTAASLS